MKMWNRIYTSFVRRPYQVLLIFLIVFVLGNVLFASIAIQQSSHQVKEEMRDRVSGEVTFNRDFTDENWFSINEIEIYRMRNFVKELESTPQNYEYKMWKMMTLHFIDVRTQDDRNRMESVIGAPNIDSMIGDLNIIDGRNYLPEDFETDDFKIVLTYPIGNYKVGDTIRVPFYDLKGHEYYYGDRYGLSSRVVDYVEFEIVGIANGYLHYYDSNFQHDNIVVPLAYLEKMEARLEGLLAKQSEKQYELTMKCITHNLEHIRYDGFFVTDLIRMKIFAEGIDEVESIVKSIKKHENFAKTCFTIKTSTSDYLYVQAPLENLVALSNVTLWASVVLVISILSLVSMLFIRSRKYEIGILMSLGEKKRKVVTQFILEIVIIGLFATTLALFSGNVLGEVISKKFMGMQIDKDAEMQYQYENGNVVTQLEMINEYETHLDAEYIITIYVSSAAVLILSSLLPMLYIIRMKPKNIMLN